MINIPCIILSGGASKRMGEDKSLLPFKNFNTLIEYQHNKLSQIFSTVYISSKTNKFNFDCKILYDESQKIYSPMIALKSILKNIKEDKIFIITVDVPFIENKTFEVLCKESNKFDITLAKDQYNVHNLCGIFSKTLLPLVSSMIKNNTHRINTLLQQTTNSQVIFFKNSEQFLNINTRYEYNKFKI